MTIGKCVLRPRAENPWHFHPICEEVLVVLQGRISHEIEDGKEVVMEEGAAIFHFEIDTRVTITAETRSSGSDVLS